MVSFKNVMLKVREFADLPGQIRNLHDLILFHHTKVLQCNHSNPLNRYGKKCFSQADEDGITLEILRRIKKLSEGTYAEFGVGDGTENNTLILAALGWKGFWVGGEELRLDINNKDGRLFFFKEWVTSENIVSTAKKGLKAIDVEQLDVISLDLDFNDIYFVEELLANNFKPKLFIAEYNAKFPPPVEFKISYDPQRTWEGDDHFGASLSSFNKLFEKFGYRLICCNSQTGSNAFFIDDSFSELFSDVPTDINQIYVEPRYHLYNNYGHRKSVTTIEELFR